VGLLFTTFIEHLPKVDEIVKAWVSGYLVTSEVEECADESPCRRDIRGECTLMDIMSPAAPASVASVSSFGIETDIWLFGKSSAPSSARRIEIEIAHLI
jgi:hypothetical protein